MDTSNEVLTLNARWPRAPYPGLRPFRVTASEDESLIFYGRNRHKDDILARLSHSHVVFVTGPSGCGKSSLIKAGVIPVLEAGFLLQAGFEWITCQMRPGQSPLASLRDTMAMLAPDSTELVGRLVNNEVSGLWMIADVIKGKGTGKARILLLIDQFEELFTPVVGNRAEVDQFIRLLVRFFEKPHPDLYVVVTMRSDFIGQCTNFSGLAQLINQAQFLTPILGVTELEEAICRPIEDYHGKIEPLLLNRLLLDMRSGITYDPDNLALLQHALLHLWRQACLRHGFADLPKPAMIANKTIFIDLDCFVEAGGLRGIINASADSELAKLSHLAGGCETTEIMFKRLAERDLECRYRRCPTRLSKILELAEQKDTLTRIVSDLSSPEVELIELRDLDGSNDPLVDLCHEALIRRWDKYRAWVDQESEKLRFVQELAASAIRWQSNRQEADYLLQGSALSLVEGRWCRDQPTEEWAQRYPLTSGREERLSGVLNLVKSFLDASRSVDKAERARLEDLKRREISARTRAQRDRIVAACLALIVLLGVTLWKYFDSRKQTAILKAGAISVLARNALDELNDPARGLLLALEGLKLPEENETFEPLVYHALQQLRLKRTFPSSEDFNVVSSSFSPISKIVLSAYQNGKLRFWSLEKGALGEFAIPNSSTGVFWRARWSPDGYKVIISGKDSATILSVCEIDAIANQFPKCQDSLYSKKMTEIRYPGMFTNAAIAPDGKTILVQEGASFLSGSGHIFNISDAGDVKEIAALPGKVTVTVGGATFSADGERFAVTNPDGAVQIYRTSDRELLATLSDESGTRNPIWCVTFSPLSSQIVYTGHLNGVINKWQVQSGEAMKPNEISKDKGFVFQLAMTQDADFLASSSDDGKVNIVQLNNPARPPIRLSMNTGGIVGGLDFAHGNEGILATSGGRDVQIWSIRSALPPTIESAVAPNGDAERTIISAASEGNLVKIKGPAGDVSLTRPESKSQVSLAASNSDGSFYAIAEEEGRVTLYRASYPNRPVVQFVPQRSWASITFGTNPDRVIAYSKSGERISWRYFKDLISLQKYAAEQVPLYGQKQLELNPKWVCWTVESSCD
jgi:WD40 repeat protein